MRHYTSQTGKIKEWDHLLQSHALLVKMWVVIALWEKNSLAASIEIKNPYTLWPNDYTPGNVANGNKRTSTEG